MPHSMALVLINELRGDDRYQVIAHGKAQPVQATFFGFPGIGAGVLWYNLQPVTVKELTHQSNALIHLIKRRKAPIGIC